MCVQVKDIIINDPNIIERIIDLYYDYVCILTKIEHIHDNIRRRINKEFKRTFVNAGIDRVLQNTIFKEKTQLVMYEMEVEKYINVYGEMKPLYKETPYRIGACYDYDAYPRYETMGDHYHTIKNIPQKLDKL